MKKIISFLLVLVLLFTQIPCAFAAEPFEQCQITMSGNLIGTGVPTPCLNVDSIAYIPAEYAAMAGDCNYEMTDTGMNFYGRGFDFVTETYYQDEQGVVWVPIASTLEQMEVLAFAAPGVLTTKGKFYLPSDVVDITDKAFNGRWRISALDGVGTAAIISATTFNIITEWKLSEFVSGKYEKDQYSEAFLLLIQDDGQNHAAEIIDNIEDNHEFFSLISQIQGGLIDAQKEGGIFEAFKDVKISDGEKILAAYKKVTENIDKYIDIEDQLEIIQFILSIMTASSYYVDMIDTVFFSDVIRDIYSGKWGKRKMIVAAEEILDFFHGDSYMEIVAKVIEKVIEKEVESLVHSTIDKATEPKTADLVEALKTIYDQATTLWTGTAHSETIEDEEMTYYLAKIQATAKKLYWAYSSVEGAELEAKYAALLYLRCAEVWSYLFEEQVPEANFIGYREVLNIITSEIMNIPDFDINGIVQNEEIYYEDIKTPEIPEPELPPPPAAGKFSTVITVDGFEYQYDIQFNHDGTAFIGGGIPFSENDETYNGTYTLLEDEEPNTYRFNVNGGFIYDIADGPSNPQDYELVIRVTPIPNSEEYTVTILSESAPLFYTHDLPNFTFIPYE
ncbi:MAG: hypothetical protein II230_03975 [Clostridia bacterium]|nr:hypothetical protein [Clostridia bacterium]